MLKSHTGMDRYIEALAALPPSALDFVVLSTVHVTIALEDLFVSLDRDPEPILAECLDRQMAFLRDAESLSRHLAITSDSAKASVDVAELFQAAWTTYTPKTYDHSISLIEDRFSRNGLDRAFFAGKRCFDGGSGTGRLSIAIAKLGADEVVSADIGVESLSFLQQQAARLKVERITTVQCDVTDLSRFPNESFDFVASYGVLHHTPDCIGGLKEHFRILKDGGTMWLYLYGAGGIYWAVYDRLREVVSNYPIAEVKRSLQKLNLREGLIYSYLDNVLAPRTYHSESEIYDVLRAIDPSLTYSRAKGGSVVDDTEKVLSSTFGKEVVGPQGEVRLILKKS